MGVACSRSKPATYDDILALPEHLVGELIDGELQGFEIVGAIESIQIIAIGRRIRYLRGLRKHYGKGRWRKLKGIARVRLPDGTIRLAELHWYEAHGIGRRRVKIKRFLD